jgi:hypothetical protein
MDSSLSRRDPWELTAKVSCGHTDTLFSAAYLRAERTLGTSTSSTPFMKTPFYTQGQFQLHPAGTKGLARCPPQQTIESPALFQVHICSMALASVLASARMWPGSGSSPAPIPSLPISQHHMPGQPHPHCAPFSHLPTESAGTISYMPLDLGHGLSKPCPSASSAIVPMPSSTVIKLNTPKPHRSLP